MKKIFLPLILVGLMSLATSELILGYTQVPSPKYIRSVKIDNKSGRPVAVSATYESRFSEGFLIPVAASKVVEHSIEQGTYTTVDPIKMLRVGTYSYLYNMNIAPTSIEVHHYTVVEDGSLRRES